MVSHSLNQGIFLTQRSNPGLLHCRWILYCLSHQGSPKEYCAVHQITALTSKICHTISPPTSASQGAHVSRGILSPTNSRSPCFFPPEMASRCGEKSKVRGPRHIIKSFQGFQKSVITSTLIICLHLELQPQGFQRN